MNRISRVIILISIAVLILGLIAPFIFTRESLISALNFTQTGQIGDTIGGIMNPFISIVGVFVTFLAFYIQLLANNQAIRQFETNISNENQKIINKKKEESLSLIKLIIHDSQLLIENFDQMIIMLQTYSNSQLSNLLTIETLKRTPIAIYKRINEFDRLKVFEAFNFQFNHIQDWEKHFSILFNISNYYAELFPIIFEKYEAHSKDIFSKKVRVSEQLIEWSYKSKKVSDILSFDKDNQFSVKIKAILDSGLNEIIRITDLASKEKVEFDFYTMKLFLKDEYLNKIEEETQDIEHLFPDSFYELLELVSGIIKDLSQIEFDNFTFANQIKIKIDDLILKKENKVLEIEQFKETLAFLRENINVA